MRSLILVFAIIALTGCTKDKPSQEPPTLKSGTDQQGVFFVNLEDGQKVSGKFEVKFDVRGMKVHPAGEIKEGTGHHHLIIDGSFIEKGDIVPSDETHLHFGDGAESTKIRLKPGPHKLTLQFADGAHKSYGNKWSKTITVNVE